MSNRSRGGLHPVYMLGGGDWKAHVIKCEVPAGDGTALGIGDAVVYNNTHNTTEVKSLSKYQIGTLPQVIKATPGDNNPILGIITAVEMSPDDRNTPYRKANTQRVVSVAAHPDIVFVGALDDVLDAADLGRNANLVNGTLDTVNGISGTKVDATVANDESYQLLVLGVAPDSLAQDLGLAGANVLVKISRHQYGPSTGSGLGA